MGKKGPCCHCGITSTPLWRNGPPGKPVLCNACGSRWRTRGTLTNYTPLHARAFMSLDSEDSQNSQEDKSQSMTKPENWHIKDHIEGDMEDKEMFDPYPIGLEDAANNGSSSGSAISISESCIQLASVDGNDFSGPVQSSFLDLHIPSKKRTNNRCPKLSLVEKLRRDLLKILQQEPSYLSGSSEEVLIYAREDSTFPLEIGHGSYLLKPPISFKEEESEARSLIIENKASCLNEPHLGSSCLSQQSQNTELNSSQVSKDGLIEEIEDNNKSEEIPSLGRPLLQDPGVLYSTHAPQISVELNKNNERFKSENENYALTSHAIRRGISQPAKRPLEPPYFQTYGGTSSDAARTFKRPQKRMVIEMPCSILDSMKAVQVEPINKNLQMNAPFDVSFLPSDRYSSSPAPKQRANVVEETKPTANMF